MTPMNDNDYIICLLLGFLYSIPLLYRITLCIISCSRCGSVDNAEITYNITKEHVTIDGNSFSANAAGVYTLTATRAATDFYAASTSE